MREKEREWEREDILKCSRRFYNILEGSRRIDSTWSNCQLFVSQWKHGLMRLIKVVQPKKSRKNMGLLPHFAVRKNIILEHALLCQMAVAARNAHWWWWWGISEIWVGVLVVRNFEWKKIVILIVCHSFQDLTKKQWKVADIWSFALSNLPG